MSPSTGRQKTHTATAQRKGDSTSDKLRYVRLACALVEVIVPGISRPARGATNFDAALGAI